jgi:diketogulonate reductase-like aldo/keto reductase
MKSFFRMRSWKALEELHDELKVRAIGVSDILFPILCESQIMCSLQEIDNSAD